MDLFDRASEAETLFRDQALRTRDAIAKAMRMPSGISARHCQKPDCGVEIPDARRKALPGVRLCVDCQDRMERLKR